METSKKPLSSTLKAKPISLSKSHKNQRAPFSESKENLEYQDYPGMFQLIFRNAKKILLQNGSPGPSCTKGRNISLPRSSYSSHETSSCPHCHRDSRGDCTQKQEPSFPPPSLPPWTHTVGCFLQFQEGQTQSIYTSQAAAG